MGLEVAIIFLGILSAGSVGVSADYWFRSQRGRAQRALQPMIKASKLIATTESSISAADQAFRKAAQKHVDAVLHRALQNEPVETLRSYAKGVRLQPLDDAGIHTLLDLKRIRPGELTQLRGLGSSTAQSILQGLEAAVADIASNRVDYYPEFPLREPSGVALVKAAHDSIESHRLLEPHLRTLNGELKKRSGDVAKVDFAAKPWGWLNEFSRNSKRRTKDSLARLEICRDEIRQQCAWAEEAHSAFKRNADEMRDLSFLERHYTTHATHYAAHFSSILPFSGGKRRNQERNQLAELEEWRSQPPQSRFSDNTYAGGQRPDSRHSGADKRQVPSQSLPIRTDLRFSQGSDLAGGLPSEIARSVESFPLDVSLIAPGVMLRAYQAFGAKYLLQQKRAILGDEMGLGKTIQALAAIAHLHSQGKKHALVLAPAGTVENWNREITNFTTLTPYTPKPESIARCGWEENGGVLVCSVDGFGRFRASRIVHACDIVVVDEAHYIKNPGALRSQEASKVIGRAEYVALMSGTPMENRIEEFMELVSLTQPAIASSIRGGLLGRNSKLGSIVAPIYLRRNQDDVLHELPEMIEIDEWVDFSEAELEIYGQHILSSPDAGNLMRTRQISSLPLGSESSKMARIGELLNHYEATGEKVVIFSFFLDSLAALEKRFTCMGRIDGSMVSRKRLQLIDDLADYGGHAILLSQIQAGGIGLNIQSANVVIILEPQFKPSTEYQAIARLHRMGQLRKVVVHRMLARNAVEIALRDRLISKQEEFDRSVRESEIKDHSYDAKDTAFLNDVIAREAQRFA